MPSCRVLFSAVLILNAATCLAQSAREPADAWLMQNYRFVPAPAPGEIQRVSPAVAQLQEIQNTTLNILRKANLYGDFEAALAAAAQATATAQLIGTLTGQLKPPPARPAAAEEPTGREPQYYLVAFTDQTIQAATAVWTDRLMLHYTTRPGAHLQVRLDRVDWKLSAELNLRRGVSAP